MNKVLIFDLDGTVLDSMSVWNNLGRSYLESKNIDARLDLESIIETMTLEEAAEYCIKEYGISDSIECIVLDIVRMVEDNYKYEVQLKQGVKEYLEEEYILGSRMCILTSSDDSYIDAALKRVGVYDYFESIYTCGQLGLSKNSSDIYSKTCELMNVKPEEAIVFEDAQYAIDSARAAGCIVIQQKNDKAFLRK
mgnify:CR=1 FL=1